MLLRRAFAFGVGLFSIFLLLFGCDNATAQISYSVIDSIYSQDFNSLPTNIPQNVNIETQYPTGWTDNSTSINNSQVSVPGWYLWHPTAPASENGANDHQRLRVGPGANTGSFWLFGDSNAAPDKALGSVGSTTIAGNGASMYMGLHLVNDTGQTLTGFSVAYDGEQWRDGQGTDGETMQFAYSLGATIDGGVIGTAEAGEWMAPDTSSFIAVPDLNFTSPVTAGTSSGGTAVDGNVLGRESDVHAMISGISWLPGQSLWLRWGDPQLASLADDGLAVDNVRFSTGSLGISGPDEILSIASGNASSPSTWDNNEAPAAGRLYRVQSGHTVTVNYTDQASGTPFPGNELRVSGGGVTHFNTSGVHVPLLILETGADITESVSGDFALGDIFASSLGVLQTLADVSFDVDAGANFFLDMRILGTGDFDFATASGSRVWLTAAGGHGGTIRFNGSGDRVMITEGETFGTLEMNSTGANTVFYNPTAQADSGTLIFNAPGIVDHAATSVTPQRRLHGVNTLVANATITVDLTKGFPNNDPGAQIEERRFQVATSMSGSADVIVNGSATDFSNGLDISMNEFEVGGSDEPSNVNNINTSTYSGTLTHNGFVNGEFRQHFPNARFVINDNARVEFGHRAPVPALGSVRVGEMVVNDGGILEVGFEQSYGTALDSPNTGHNIYKLTLTDEGTRDASLTINEGGILRMQVNGAAAGQFDQIETVGNVSFGPSSLNVGGILNVLVNADAASGAEGRTELADWTPMVGEKIDIIVLIGGGGALTGDINADGSVDAADFVMSQKLNPGDMNEYADIVENFGETGGGSGAVITGQFEDVVVTDYNGAFTGFDFQVNYLADRVQLEVVAAGSGGSNLAVPEPATIVLLALLLPLFPARRRVAA